MTRVRCASTLDAVVAVVPVRAVQALVTNAIDALIAAIADREVANVATGGKLGLSGEWQNSLGSRSFEGMSRVMAMLVSGVALDAQIEVGAVDAGDELGLWVNNHAVVACAGWSRHFSQHLGFLGLERTRHLRLRFDAHWERCNLAGDTLGLACDDTAIFDEALDEPVALAAAVLVLSNTLLAEIEIAGITDGAVVVCIGHGLVALVAVDRPGVARHHSRLNHLARAESEGLAGQIESLSIVGEGPWDGSLIDESLLRGTSLAELEDTASYRATIHRGGLTRET
jgi:hypothetical protein